MSAFLIKNVKKKIPFGVRQEGFLSLLWGRYALKWLFSCAKRFVLGVFQVQRFNHLSDVLYGDKFNFILVLFAGFHVFSGENYSFKARLNTLVDTLIGIGNGANLTRQTHFAEQRRILVDGDIVCRRGKRRANSKVNGGLF